MMKSCRLFYVKACVCVDSCGVLLYTPPSLARWHPSGVGGKAENNDFVSNLFQRAARKGEVYIVVNRRSLVKFDTALDRLALLGEARTRTSNLHQSEGLGVKNAEHPEFSLPHHPSIQIHRVRSKPYGHMMVGARILCHSLALCDPHSLKHAE